MPNAEITAEPRKALFDQDIDIQVHHLAPNQPVTLRSVLVSEIKDVFHCIVHYEADKEGVVRVKSQRAIGGMYTGIERMGLFWGMKESKILNKRKNVALFKKDASTPYVVSISVYSGHFDEERDILKAKPITKVEVERWYLADYVERTPVHHGRVRGFLYIPKASGPFPGVLDVRGNGGGIQDFRGALLASKGFVTFCIAYLAYKDLPAQLDMCDIEYFEEGAKFLHSHPKVIKGGVGAFGFSYGAMVVQAMASYCPLITATVSINGPHYGQIIPFKYKNRNWRAMQMDEKLMKVEKGAIVVKESFNFPDNPNWDESLTIDLCKAKGPLMLITGDGDKTFYSSWCSEEARKMMDSGGKTNYEIVRYPDAGHFIEPPYNPFFCTFVHKMERRAFLVGGTKLGAKFANQDSWQRIIAFFKKHLTPPTSSNL